MMKIGICTRDSEALALTNSGADYIELGVANVLNPQMDDIYWQEKCAFLQALPLPTETFNLFLPGDLKITGEESNRSDSETIRRYIFTALKRARAIGGKVIVFGSGGARRVPEGFSRDRATEQIRTFLRVCAEASEETGVIIAIEPLNQRECNIINTVAEAVNDYAAPLAHPGIRVLADTYHMELEKEPLSVIPQYAPFIAHTHTADTQRVPPGQGVYDHVALFQALREANYTGRLSIEANFTDIVQEAKACFTHLRQAERLVE